MGLDYSLSLVAPILAFTTFSISPIIRSQLRSKANLNALTQNHLIEVLTGIQTVKAQNFELNARWRWKDRYSDYVAQGFKNAVTSTTANGLTQFLNQVSSLSDFMCWFISRSQRKSHARSINCISDYIWLCYCSFVETF